MSVWLITAEQIFILAAVAYATLAWFRIPPDRRTGRFGPMLGFPVVLLPLMRFGIAQEGTWEIIPIVVEMVLSAVMVAIVTFFFLREARAIRKSQTGSTAGAEAPVTERRRAA